jgi:ribosomal protein S18 acetylase RimI-like enzyme
MNQRAGALNPFALRGELRPSDRDEIRAILASTAMFYPYEIDVALELVDDALAKGARSEYAFLLAELSGAVVGYICFGPIAVTDRRYDLYWIAVHQGKQGLGIGSVLLQEAEKAVRAQGGRYLIIETSSRAVYEPTRAFYHKHGYQEVARVPEYYGDHDDRVIYMRAL